MEQAPVDAVGGSAENHVADHAGDSAVSLVTVSREYGAGGSEFAQLLGTRLGWRVLDHDIVESVAGQLHLRAGVVEERDEQPPGWFSRIAAALLVAPPESPMQLDTAGVLTLDCIADATHAALMESAATPPVVIVGHGAQCVFHARPGTMHVRLVGTPESRAARIMARDGGTEQDAIALARRVDARRRAYVQRYYHHDWADPLLFDMAFNTVRVTVAEAVAAVASVIEAREPARASSGGA
jgi:cytidylate kinase